MTKAKRKWLLGSVAVAAVSLTAAGYSLWRASELRTAAVSSIPAQPRLSDRPSAFSQRVRDCENTIRSGSDVIGALAELSQLYHANGLYAEATQCYRGLLRIDPSNPRWPHRFATIIAGYGQLENAAELWRRTLQLAKDYTPACIHLADLELKLNRPSEASALYNAVLQRDPDNPYALVGLARIDIDASRWSAARQRLEASVGKSQNSVGYDLLVNVCEQLGDTARAQEIRAQRKASGAFIDIPDPWMTEIYIDCYDSYALSVAGGTADREGDRGTALRLVERAVNLEPDNAYYHFQLGSLHMEAGNATEARQHFEKAVGLKPDLSDAWESLFRLLTEIGQPEEARRALGRGLAYCPSSPGLHFLRGRLLLDQHNFEEAILDFQQAAAARPDDASAFFALALIYSTQGRKTESRTALQAALTAEPGYPPALCTLARDYIVGNDEPNASIMMKQIKDQPRVPPQERLKLERAFQEKFGRAPSPL